MPAALFSQRHQPPARTFGSRLFLDGGLQFPVFNQAAQAVTTQQQSIAGHQRLFKQVNFHLGLVAKRAVDQVRIRMMARLVGRQLLLIDQQLHQMGWGLVWLVMVVSVIFGGISGALAAVLSAVLYNLVTGVSGGIVVHAAVLNAAAAGPALAYTPAALPPPPSTPSPAPAPAAKSYGGPALVAVGGSSDVWPLHGAVTIVGSAPSCNIQVAGLATLHAEVRLENGRYVIYDMSGGQTWVNDRQVTTANLLKDGFRVRLGVENFLFQAPAGP